MVSEQLMVLDAKLTKELGDLFSNKDAVSAITETLVNDGENINLALVAEKCKQAYSDNKEWFATFHE